MRKGWRETTLGEIAEWGSGGTPKAGETAYYSGVTIPWAVIADIQDAPLLTTASTITDAGLAQIGHMAPADAVLVTMYGTVGRVALTRFSVATNQAIAWGIPNKSAVLPEFLFILLRSHAAKLDSLARGATQRNINRAIIRSLPISLPPLDVQRRIVDLVSALDGHIKSLRAEAQALTRMTLTAAVPTAPTERRPLGIRVSARGGKRMPNGVGFAGEVTDHAYLRVIDMVDGTFNNAALEYVPEHVWPSISRYTVKAGEIVVSIVGTIGRIAVVPPWAAGANLTENAAIIDILDDELDGRWLAAWLRSDEGQKEIQRVTVGTSQGKLALSRIPLIEVPDVPRGTQESLAQASWAAQSQVGLIKRELVRGEAMRTYLLTTLLSGAHEIPPSYDTLVGKPA